MIYKLLVMTTNITTENNYFCLMCECYEGCSKPIECAKRTEESEKQYYYENPEPMFNYKESKAYVDFCSVSKCTGCDNSHEFAEVLKDSDESVEWIQDNNSLMEKPPGTMDRTVFVNNLCDEYKTLSMEAQKFIMKNFEINKILRIRETMQPEDFDEDGPTEENWDLFVQTLDKNVHHFSYHHFWSHGARLGYSMNY